MEDPAQLLTGKLTGCCTQPKTQAASALGNFAAACNAPPNHIPLVLDGAGADGG